MNPDLLIKIHNTIDLLNHSQQSIARNLLTNRNFLITEMFLYNTNKLVIKDLSTGEIWIFVDYIRRICNCG